MPQGRILLKSICQSKKLPKLKTDGARLLYTWLIPNVDVNGCFSGDPQVLKGQVFTRLKKSNKTIESYLQDLEDIGLIIRYEVDGDIFLIIPDFADKQPSLKPEKEAKPTIPLPPPELLQSKSGVTPSISKVKGSKDKGKQSKYHLFFEEIWIKYPNQVGKKEALRHFKVSVKTENDWKDINRALDNYLKTEKFKKGFIQNGSTWFNNWRDYINYREPKSSGKLTPEDL